MMCRCLEDGAEVWMIEVATPKRILTVCESCGRVIHARPRPTLNVPSSREPISDRES